MRINGEMFVLVNTLANSLSLWLAARLLSGPVPEWKSILYAALVGAAYGIAAFLPGLSFLRTAPFVLLSALMMAKILFPRLRPLIIVKEALLILFCGLLLGGLLSWLTLQGIPPWLAFVALFLSIAGFTFFCGIKVPSPSKVTMVEISPAAGILSAEPIRLPAMLDTGNQLTDPITGLPVVVASSNALKAILPPCVKPEDPQTLPVGFRFLRVQTAAGHGLMMCFRPSLFRVFADGQWHDGQALIAIAPTGYDGAQALVPSAVAETLHLAGSQPPIHPCDGNAADIGSGGGTVPSLAHRSPMH